MQTIPKDQIESQLGKGSFWLPVRLLGAEYLYGIPEFDAAREAKPSKVYAPLTITMLPNGLEIQILHQFKSYKVGLAFSDIKRIELEIPEDIVTKQDRSVIGRAVIGGLLLGPVGALVGGMSGLKEGTKTESGDALLTIQVEQTGQESFFVATVPKNKRSSIQEFVQKHLAQFTNN